MVIILILAIIIVTTCASIDNEKKSTGQIFLYGESHGFPEIMERQLEIWYDYYHNHNLRHMFIEFAYFTAELLNIWMLSDNDDLLYELFNEDWFDAVPSVSYYLDFLKTIKREFPETTFHGVDIGFGYWAEGKLFLQYLKDNNEQGTERYLLTLESIEQGKHFGRTDDFEFRVTKMTENFIREFDRLLDQNVMAINGAAHATLGFYNYNVAGRTDVPTMAQRLRLRYGDSLHIEDLSILVSINEPISINAPIRVDIITINGIDYEASYFGTDFTAFRNIVSRSFWRLENAYEDFKDKPTTGDFLPFDNYPMKIELNQVFIVDVTFRNGTVSRLFYRSEGGYWRSTPITTGFIVE